MPSDALPDDLETLKAMLLAEQCESERLRQIIKELQRHRFGRRAETLPEDQMLPRPRRRRANGGERCGDSRSVGSGPTNRAGREATHQPRLVAGAFANGSRSSSISTAGPAPAARASCTGWGRTRAS